jgi:hypothetical protein
MRSSWEKYAWVMFEFMLQMDSHEVSIVTNLFPVCLSVYLAVIRSGETGQAVSRAGGARVGGIRKFMPSG